MATWPGGSCWSFCCCVGVLGVITLKPDATSMFSLFWVLPVVAQPTVNANRAMMLIMLNELRICFIFLFLAVSVGICRFDGHFANTQTKRFTVRFARNAYLASILAHAGFDAQLDFGRTRSIYGAVMQ